jgi:hypothetical protein
MRVLATASFNIVPCKESMRMCFELGDYLPNKDLGNIFSKFFEELKTLDKLEEYLQQFKFRAVTRQADARSQFKNLLNMVQDPCHHLVVTRECIELSGKEKQCYLEIYQPIVYWEYEQVADTPEEREKLRQSGEAAEIYRVGLNMIARVRIDQELVNNLRPRRAIQETHNPEIRKIAFETYIKKLREEFV